MRRDMSRYVAQRPIVFRIPGSCIDSEQELALAVYVPTLNGTDYAFAETENRKSLWRPLDWNPQC